MDKWEIIGNNDLRAKADGAGGFWHLTLRDADDGDVIIVNEDDLELLRDKINQIVAMRDRNITRAPVPAGAPLNTIIDERVRRVCRTLGIPDNGPSSRTIRLALLEQDRDTRHACAEAVIDADDAHAACMNAQIKDK